MSNSSQVNISNDASNIELEIQQFLQAEQASAQQRQAHEAEQNYLNIVSDNIQNNTQPTSKNKTDSNKATGANNGEEPPYNPYNEVDPSSSFMYLVMQAIDTFMQSVTGKEMKDAQMTLTLSNVDSAILNKENEVLLADAQNVEKYGNNNNPGPMTQYQTDSAIFQSFDQRAQGAMQTAQTGMQSDSTTVSDTTSFASQMVQITQDVVSGIASWKGA